MSTVQRPVWDHSSAMHTQQRGLWHIYITMRLLCYHSYTQDDATKDVLFRCSHGISAMPLGTRYYIREDRLSLALTADPLLEAQPVFDLYI